MLPVVTILYAPDFVIGVGVVMTVYCPGREITFAPLGIEPPYSTLPYAPEPYAKSVDYQPVVWIVTIAVWLCVAPGD